ncbi:MAG: class I tRNA ligase family protein [Nanoarchaeota archaeon]
MTKKNYFQVSTAIDYPSSRFHLGHGYEKICTDVIARWRKLEGFKVHFSTGTDCHGLKIQRAAEKAGKTPLEFVTEISAGFKELCKVLNILYDDFIMTIEERHKKVAQYIMDQLYKKGEIYKGYYEGPYCVDCETYYTEKDLIDGNCPVHKKPVEIIKEESYFFKLNKYQDFLIKYINDNPNCIWPDNKRKEILNKLKQPLRDLSISRKEVNWGIPLPFDKNLTEFVWIEALNNYLTTISYPDKKYKAFWPATHLIGVDIVFHHTIIWFSLLKALNLEIPRIVVHGFINLKGQKLSKAAGIRIDPIELAKTYGTDPLRYFLIREIPFGQDGDFSEEALKDRLNNELANDLGNLVSRSLTMVEKYFDGKIPNGKNELKFDIDKIEKLMENYELTTALAEIWKLVQEINRYINKEKPWENEKNRETVLYGVLDSLRIVSILLYSFIPESCKKISKQIGFKIESLNDCKVNLLKKGKIKKGEILFKKVE